MMSRMVSHRVAPMPMYPSRSETGTERITSRLTATTIGRIMIASTNPARKMLSEAGEVGSSLKIGITLPMLEAIHHSMESRMRSDRSPTAQRPITTEGIAAISSTMKASVAESRRGASSTR